LGTMGDRHHKFLENDGTLEAAQRIAGQHF
jgi:hypothetical protein